MRRIKYIIISASLALIILLVITYIINFSVNKTYINIAILSKEVKEGEKINSSNVEWVKIESSKINISNYITEKSISDLEPYVINFNAKKGQIIWKDYLVKQEDYIEKVDGLEYIALPIKSATEGVCYKIKKGDKIAVYYTAKNKLVEQLIKEKKKIYSASTSESLVTCLLYEDLEIIALTNNIGKDAEGNNITDIVVRLTQEQALELANLKEQGTFTLSIK